MEKIYVTEICHFGSEINLCKYRLNVPLKCPFSTTSCVIFDDFVIDE